MAPAASPLTLCSPLLTNSYPSPACILPCLELYLLLTPPPSPPALIPTTHTHSPSSCGRCEVFQVCHLHPLWSVCPYRRVVCRAAHQLAALQSQSSPKYACLLSGNQIFPAAQCTSEPPPLPPSTHPPTLSLLPHSIHLLQTSMPDGQWLLHQVTGQPTT